MTADEVVAELRALGSESIKNILSKHGIAEPLFGVRIGDMKPLQRRIKTDHQLALDLFDTGIYDAMYLAGLIADDARMTRKDLDRWAAAARVGLSASVVPWVAAGSPHGAELAVKWIESKKEHVAVAGWSTLSSLVSVKPDAELDVAQLGGLLKRVARTIHDAPNDVRYAMNGFVIALGTYCAPLADAALAAAERIGRVSVDVGETSCKVPYAPDYIRKSRVGGTVRNKRKSAKC